MKKIFILFLLFCVTQKCFCQSIDQWKNYSQDSVYHSENPNYVYLKYSKGGIFQKTLNVSLKQNKQIFSINYADTSVVQKGMLQPDIFHLIKVHLTQIKNLRGYLNNPNKVIKFKRAYLDSTITFIELGIKFYDLYYFHFPNFPIEERKKNREYAKGMKIINKIRSILEKAEVKFK